MEATTTDTATAENQQQSTTLLGGAEKQQQQTQTFTPSYDGVLGADGKFADNWHAKAFGPEYTGPLAGVKDVGSLDKMLRDNMAAARQAGIRPLTDKSTPEEILAWKKAVGAPDKPDGYGSLRPDNFPEALWDKDNEARLTQIAHKHHLPPAVLKDLLGVYSETVDQQMKQMEAEGAASVAGERAKLESAWGEKFNDNLRIAQRAATTIGLDMNDPIFNRADVVLAMAKIASLTGEERLINGQTVGLPASNKERANSIMTDAKDPLYQKYQSGDPDTVALVTNMLQGR